MQLARNVLPVPGPPERRRPSAARLELLHAAEVSRRCPGVVEEVGLAAIAVEVDADLASSGVTVYFLGRERK